MLLCAYTCHVPGTTGKPKGVEVMHRNVTNCEIHYDCEALYSPLKLVVCLSPGNVEMLPGRRVAQLLNIAFDMAAWVCNLIMCRTCAPFNTATHPILGNLG